MQKQAMFEDVRSALRDRLLEAAAGYAKTPEGQGRVNEVLRALEPADLRSARRDPSLMTHLPSPKRAFLARLLQENSADVQPALKKYMRDPRNYPNISAHLLRALKSKFTGGSAAETPSTASNPLMLNYSFRKMQGGS
jgi:hypothetical protein